MRPVSTAALAAALLAALPVATLGQDMMRHVNLSSPAMTEAELTRAQVEARLAAATADKPADFTNASLNGLDLSALDLSGAVFRAARLNKANLKGANLTGASIRGTDLFGADLSGATWIDGALVCAEGSIGQCR